MVFTIGQLAKVAGVKISTIRFYERRGLVPVPDRTASSYRQYSKDTIFHILFIKNAQALGFTLEEISELLTLQNDAKTSCKSIKSRAAEKIKSIDGKIHSLQKIKSVLMQLQERCPGQGPLSQCTILESLNKNE